LTLATITGVLGLLTLLPAAQADVRVGQNYRLNSDSNTFRGKDQVALAVDPSNSQHIVETNANYLTERCEATASFDGGVTWNQAVDLVPPTPAVGLGFQPSCRISNHLGESMFQTVAFGSGQNVYATSITPRLAAFGEEGASTLIYKSTDGGVTWGTGVVAMAGGPGSPGGATVATGPYYELPTLAVDPGAGPGGADIVYSAAHEATGNANSTNPPCPGTSCPSARVATSLDGGQTFSAPVQTSAPGVPVAGPDSASPPVVSPDHSVSVAWRTQGVNGTIQIARSTDHGQTWSTPVDVTGVSNVSRPSTSHVTPATSTGSSFPRLAVNKTNGNLYIVYNQGPPGPTAPAGGYQGADHFINPDSHVYFQRSTTNGATWSTPKLIDDITPHPGSQTIQTRHPNVAVAPNGRIDIVWEDRRHWYQGPGEHNCVHTHLACDDARLGDTYYSYSTDNGASFSANRRITDHSHNNDVGYDYRFGTGWAFGPQTVALGNDTLLVGWMDSREGSFDNDNQDIYLAKVDLAASGSIPQTNVDEPDPVALSVALSKLGYQGGGESTLAATFATKNSTRVVIVNEGDVAGALAGAVLARANLAPVLLSPAAGLPASVKNEIARLNPAGAYIVGDASALSAQVVSDVTDAGVAAAQVTRVSGGNTAETAAAVAAAFDRRTPAEKAAAIPAFDAAIIANPGGPDAAAAAALAAARRLPILYASTDNVPAATAAALTSLNITKTLVIGGPAQISDATMASLPAPTRLGGADQYATSKAVAAESVARGLPTNIVYVADGTRPMDAALLGAVVGRATGIMLLAPSPLYANAPTAASSAGLGSIDRFVVVGPSPPAPSGGGEAVTPPPPPPPPAAVSPPPPPPPAALTPAKCTAPKLVKTNASRFRVRTDTRLRQRCAGTMKATATTVARVRGKLRTVRLKATVTRLSGLNRAVRVSLTSSVLRSQLHRTGRLTIRVRTVFTPAVLSSVSKKSTKTITVTVRAPKQKATSKKSTSTR
jgi:putative cell wall-binding protein